MIFDTHTHYDDKSFDADRDELVGSLPAKNVGRICNIGSSFRGAEESVRLSELYIHVYAAAGVHPDEVYDFYDGGKDAAGEEERGLTDGAAGYETLNDAEGNRIYEKLRALASHEKVRAIGEIGLDYHGFGVFETKPCRALQKYWFKKQLELAIELGKPVVIHSRNASEDTMEMMVKAREDGLKCAVIHCYSYSKETALKYLDMGFYLGFGGVITYEGQKKLTRVLEVTPMDRVLIETDCPYLTPVPIRVQGEYSRNNSAYLPYVIKKISEIKGISPEEVESVTWDNANRFYGI